MKKLTAEKCREQFEAWASNDGTFPRAIEKRDGQYILLATQSQWQTWQASREALEQQERGDGEWIEWGGGSRPVPLWEPIEVRLRSGNSRSGQTAAYWVWQHNGGINDIIAYRIIPEQPTNQTAQQSGTLTIEGTMPTNQNAEQ